VYRAYVVPEEPAPEAARAILRKHGYGVPQ